MKKEFGTYSIVPTEIMINKKISSTAKILYAIISSLTNEKGYCWASNKYLGEVLDIKERQISDIINTLVDIGLINSVITDNYKRKITLTGKIVVTQKTAKGVAKKCVGGSKKVLHNNIKEYYKDNTILADKSAEQEVEHLKVKDDINSILEEFYTFNPGLNFGNKTQREAVSFLLSKYDKEKLLAMITWYKSKLSDRFCPVATTPLAFKNKLGEIMVYAEKLKQPSKGGITII